MSAISPGRSLLELDRLKIFNMTAQFQHDIECFRRRAVFQAGGHGPASGKPCALCRSASFRPDLGHRTERTVDGM
jgi:hypothetical protein